jgi:uncharacterized phiE125 gp8 family phage protein
MNGKNNGYTFHSLVPLAEAKAFLGVDDRDDSLLGFLLVSGAYAVEEYCARRLLRKRVKEWFVDTADPVFPLREYPVREVSAAVIADGRGGLVPVPYSLLPDGGLLNVPYTLRVFPGCMAGRLKTVGVKYVAGWRVAEVPPDLKEACLELAAWKLARRNAAGPGVSRSEPPAGLENRMPERVRELLEPYRRKMI